LIDLVDLGPSASFEAQRRRQPEELLAIELRRIRSIRRVDQLSLSVDVESSEAVDLTRYLLIPLAAIAGQLGPAKGDARGSGQSAWGPIQRG
jgi:hypothetical protein